MHIWRLEAGFGMALIMLGRREGLDVTRRLRRTILWATTVGTWQRPAVGVTTVCIRVWTARPERDEKADQVVRGLTPGAARPMRIACACA